MKELILNPILYVIYLICKTISVIANIVFFPFIGLSSYLEEYLKTEEDKQREQQETVNAIRELFKNNQIKVINSIEDLEKMMAENKKEENTEEE